MGVQEHSHNFFPVVGCRIFLKKCFQCSSLCWKKQRCLQCTDCGVVIHGNCRKKLAVVPVTVTTNVQTPSSPRKKKPILNGKSSSGKEISSLQSRSKVVEMRSTRNVPWEYYVEKKPSSERQYTYNYPEKKEVSL